jgi:hypothetical protein
MINATAVQTVYCIEVTVEEFQKLMDKENLGMDGNLFSKLHKLDGVYNIEYNGHFGANIWVTIDKEHDNGKTWNTIEEIINGFIK